MEALTLNCHSCGAAVTSTDPTCKHCGARLATVSCPACFNMMFRDSRFCPSCGSPSAQWDAGSSELPCANCGTLLLHGQLNEVHLHECPKCYGLWLDRNTFEYVCRTAEQKASALGPVQIATISALDPIRYRPCPECRQFMNRINFAHCSGVIVDVCRAHGTWFDANELHGIVEFIRSGGMDLSRHREKAELTATRQRLESARLDVDHGIPEPSAASPNLFSAVISAAADILGWWIH